MTDSGGRLGGVARSYRPIIPRQRPPGFEVAGMASWTFQGVSMVEPGSETATGDLPKMRGGAPSLRKGSGMGCRGSQQTTVEWDH